MRRNALLQIRIDPERYELLREFSQQSGMPMSEAVRRMIDTCLYRPDCNGGDDGQWKSIGWVPGDARKRAEAIRAGWGVA